MQTLYWTTYLAVNGWSVLNENNINILNTRRDDGDAGSAVHRIVDEHNALVHRLNTARRKAQSLMDRGTFRTDDADVWNLIQFLLEDNNAV